MQVNMLEAKTQLSKLVEAALRGEEVVIANRGRPVVRLVKAEDPPKRRWGAWEGLVAEDQLDQAFSPEADADIAREWVASLERPLEAGIGRRRSLAAIKSARPAAAASRRRK